MARKNQAAAFEGAARIDPTVLDASARKSDGANKAALGNVRVRVFGPDGEQYAETEIQKAAKPGEEPGSTKQLPEDPFTTLTEQGLIVDPPFDLLTLSMLPEHNTELTQAIEAMEINIEGFGWRFIPRVDVAKADDAEKSAIKKERTELTNFFQYASIDDSFTALRRKLRKDIETTGNGYLEIIRGPAGRIQGLEHVPSFQMRIGRLEEDPVEAEIPILELQEDGSVKAVRTRVWKRFRKYAQSRALFQRGLRQVSTGTEVRWFKELGDPRLYDNRTGLEVTDGKDPDGNEVPDKHLSNEMVHFSIYTPRSVYGLPRYIGNLLSIFGDRAAEEINFMTFKNNNIPSMALLVSNGELTQGTIDRIQSFVESQIQSSPNYSKFLLIEAEPATSDIGGEDVGQVKLDLKPLTGDQHSDALFQNYSKSNQDKVRRAFRLPPIFVGRSDDYTRATAESSRRLADEQVFAPERDSFDDWVNRRLFPEMGAVFHRYKTNSPNTTDNTQLVQILANAEKTGGMTPNIARLLLEDILGRELESIQTDRFDPDVPFSLTMAEAVKNKADPAEPGQQVTALKDEDAIPEDAAQALISGDAPAAIDRLMGIREEIEGDWTKLYTDDEE